MNSIREIPPQYVNLCPVIDQKYKVLFKLGSGRFSKVKMGIKLDTNQRVALKIMNEKIIQNTGKKEFQSNVLHMFLDEVKMCLLAKHKYIVQIIDFQVGGIYKTSDGKVKRVLYYVMKIASNGQLFRLVKQAQIFNEKIARSIFLQLVTGVQHLHSLGISHRDLKLQNILLDNKMKIKIADFGYSSFYLDSHQHKIQFNSSDAVGSIKCNAPQLTNCQNEGIYHADQVDLFACGCLLFQMVMKTQPFKSSNYNDSFYKRFINSSDKKDFWDIFSANCCPSQEFRDLIEQLLNPNPKTRMSMKQLREHPWLRGQYPTRMQYRKDLNTKLKKVTTKIRKQQEQQIKTFLKKAKSTIKEQEESAYCKYQQIILSRQVQKQILEIIQMIRRKTDQASSSHSDSSSNVDFRDLIEMNQFKKQFERKDIHQIPLQTVKKCSKKSNNSNQIDQKRDEDVKQEQDHEQ